MVASTATKALQDQYISDLEFLSTNLVDFEYAVLKGRSNYFCANRAVLVVDEYPEVAGMLAQAQEPGFDGLRESFSRPVYDSVWNKVSGNADECDALECKAAENKDNCFVYVARERANFAQVVVVNHALLAMDLAMGGFLLGEYPIAIIDEVHELPNAAISAFGHSVSEGSITALQNEVRNFVRRNLGRG